MSRQFGKNHVSIPMQKHRDGDELAPSPEPGFAAKYGQDKDYSNESTTDFNHPTPIGHSQVPNKPVSGWSDDDRGEVKNEWEPVSLKATHKEEPGETWASDSIHPNKH